VQYSSGFSTSVCDKRVRNDPQGIESRLCEELLAATVSELGGANSLAGRSMDSSAKSAAGVLQGCCDCRVVLMAVD
jgi:hypothetical protein